jgi:predicted nuclease with RNAse H fold
MLALKEHMGVDYGAKLAGTTAACWLEGEQLQTETSEKKEDADAFLERLFNKKSIRTVYIDAPLSLPEAYRGQDEDFFFREADRQLQAMSPMFLGGLTARAMKLKSSRSELRFYETYPRQLVRELNLEKHYRKNLDMFLKTFSPLLPLPLNMLHTSWHCVDSVLAWYSGFRHRNGLALAHGKADEGLIWI